MNLAINPLKRTFTMHCLCLLLLLVSRLPAQADAKPDEQTSDENVAASELFDLKFIPRSSSQFIKGWMFFGLTKVGLERKVEEINQELGPECTGGHLSKDRRQVSFGDGYVGNYYQFEYEEGRIARVRGSVYTCTGGRTGAWMDTRTEALNASLRDYTFSLEYSHRVLEKHLLGEFEDKFQKNNRRFTIALDLRNLRNCYIARANVRKELGKDNRDDVFCARDYDARYSNAKAKYHLEKSLS